MINLFFEEYETSEGYVYHFKSLWYYVLIVVSLLSGVLAYTHSSLLPFLAVLPQLIIYRWCKLKVRVAAARGNQVKYEKNFNFPFFEYRIIIIEE